ncbi:uncharacterized protein [Lepeophtheirus salmonis]|uniref:uncharacterized protein n=1 Tax=Lepeophtheirus salmonis TaxID=72036 RepID=UPI001AE1CAFA|nr:uncharacterized protein LOC121118822 [Lepeophtheirus salmonis]
MKYLVLSIFFVIALQQIDAAVVGAFETVADLNEAYEVVQETVPLIMSHFGADQSRCALYIRQIINAQQQIVSGANFRFDLELQSGGRGMPRRNQIVQRHSSLQTTSLSMPR